MAHQLLESRALNEAKKRRVDKGKLVSKRPKTKVPVVMTLIAHFVKLIYRLSAKYGNERTTLDAFKNRLLTCNRTFSSWKANDRLGYLSLVPLQEGLRRTIESYSDLRVVVYLKKKGPLKATVFLGSGMG